MNNSKGEWVSLKATESHYSLHGVKPVKSFAASKSRTVKPVRSSKDVPYEEVQASTKRVVKI